MRHLVLILWLLWPASSARAEAAAAPFEPDQLAAALEARVPSWVQRELQVESAPAGLVTLRLRGAERVLDLEGVYGREAARIVALNAADLAWIVEPSRASALPHAAAANAEASEDSPPSRGGSRRPPAWARLGLDVSMLRGGYARDLLGFEVGLRADLTFWRHLIVGAQLGYWSCPSGRSPYTDDTDLSWHALTARAWVGARISYFELGVGPSLARYWLLPVSDGAVMPSIGGYIGVSSPVVKSLELMVRAQFDYGYRDSFPEGFPTQFPPRYLFGLALGVAWGWT